MARVVIHEDVFDGIDTEPIMRRIATAIARDAERTAARRTGALAISVHVAEVSDRHAIIAATARNPRSSPEHQAYGAHVERGTSDTRAQPFMRPAAYQYRSP